MEVSLAPPAGHVCRASYSSGRSPPPRLPSPPVVIGGYLLLPPVTTGGEGGKRLLHTPVHLSSLLPEPEGVGGGYRLVLTTSRMHPSRHAGGRVREPEVPAKRKSLQHPACGERGRRCLPHSQPGSRHSTHGARQGRIAVTIPSRSAGCEQVPRWCGASVREGLSAGGRSGRWRRGCRSHRVATTRPAPPRPTRTG